MERSLSPGYDVTMALSDFTPARRYRRYVGDRARELSTQVRIALGRDVRLLTDDRRFLEDVVLPHVATHPTAPSVLFVGTAPYTKWYPRLLPHADLWTIEPDPSGKKFGARNHICAPLQDVAQHVAASSFDTIICNGVFGWGLNDDADIDAALRACAAILKPGGSFIVGWNDVPELTPAGLFSSPAWSSFVPVHFPHVGAAQHRCAGEMRHTFLFYAKA